MFSNAPRARYVLGGRYEKEKPNDTYSGKVQITAIPHPHLSFRVRGGQFL
jgi:hypothetical protein